MLAGCAGSSTSLPPSTPRGSAPPQTWLLTSDVHFNPFDDATLVNQLIASPAGEWHSILSESTKPPSPYFNDTNFALLESALAAMKGVQPNPPIVIVAGDFMAHQFPERFAKADPSAPPGAYEKFVDKTMAFLAMEFAATYPSAQFVITLGNNDGYCGNYMSTPGSPFLSHTAMAWRPLVNRGGTASNFVRQFSNGGYYSTTLRPFGAMPAIVLNSVLWSSFYQNTCGKPGSDPGADELDWLAARAPAIGGHPLLMTHIPPGIDEYASINNNAATPLYKETYTRRLLSILAGMSPSAFLLGHIHHATFEIAPIAGGQIGTLGIPSISPNQGNNPAFIVALVSPTSPMLTDTTTYALPLASLGAWSKLYSFNAAYGLQAYDSTNLLELQSSIASDTTIRRSFFNNYNSGSTTATPAPEKWRWYWCGHTQLTPAPYTDCVNQRRRPRRSGSAKTYSRPEISSGNVSSALPM
jgi:hypothetical protein